MKIRSRSACSLMLGALLVAFLVIHNSPGRVTASSTDTFYPDPHSETNKVDGTIVNTDATGFSQTEWDTFHDASAGSSVTDSNASDQIARTGKTSAGFTGNRGFVLFDTSTIGANSRVDSATGSLYVTAKTNNDNDGDDFIVFTHEATPATNTALTTGDWDQCGTTEVSERIDIGDITTGGYVDFTITDLSVINTNGITRLCVLEGHDLLDKPYAGGTDTFNDITVSFADNTGTSQDPKLTVTHSPIESDMQVQLSGGSEAESGSLVTYNVTASNNGPETATGMFVADTIPSGFTFNSSESSADCSVNGSEVTCGNFDLPNGGSTGRTISFDVNLGTCDVQRTNTVTVSGATVVDPTPGNNTVNIVTDITCPVTATYVRKTADESVSSSTTLQNDDDLKITLNAGKTYAVNGALFASSSSSNPDLKIAFTTPSGSTMDIGFHAAFGGDLRRAELLETSGSASGRIPISTNQATIVQLMGTIVVGGTAGDLTLQWAQMTSNANATTMNEGSFLSVVEIE